MLMVDTFVTICTAKIPVKERTECTGLKLRKVTTHTRDLLSLVQYLV